MPNLELNREQLEEIFPHRGRALLLDRAERPGDRMAVGYHVVTEADCEGHFPAGFIYPGHVSLEQMALTVGLAANGTLTEDQAPYFAGVDEIRWRGVVKVGDEVRTVARLTRPSSKRIIVGDAEAFVGEKLVAEAKGILCLIGSKQINS